MKTLSVSSMTALAFFLGASSVHAKLSPRQVSQIADRSSYIGGWPLALAASQISGCPSDAPVTAQNNHTTLECCPSGQTAFVDQTSYIQYCCPDKNDCLNAVLDFFACANSTWIMYQYFNGGSFFCCEPDQTATEDNGYGLCEPADVAVPTNMINKPISQDTVAPAAATSGSSTVTAATTTTASAVVVVSTDTQLSAVTTASLVGSAGTSFTTVSSTGAGLNASSIATGSNSTDIGPSLGASATATTLTSIAGGNPAFTSSPVGAATASASVTASAKTGGSGKVVAESRVMGLLAIALCFGFGAEILLG